MTFVTHFIIIFSIFNDYFHRSDASNCGCKVLRPCYKQMVEALQDGDEASCIEDAMIGSSTVVVYLKALELYCGNFTQVVHNPSLTSSDRRHLYEMHIYEDYHIPTDPRPIIVVDAGQEAGAESVALALYLIEQLVACQDNHEMIQKVRWVILPLVNPDGLENARLVSPNWRKNTRFADDSLGLGVDISRNFEGDWKNCPTVSSGFSPIFPGIAAGSENETKFVQSVLEERDIKAYLSIRRDGHSINYSYGYDSPQSSTPLELHQLEKAASAIASRVNQRAGGVYLFKNQSIYEANGKPRCGHSVDYATVRRSIKYAFEMQVFLGADSRIMSKFQNLPRGYEATLRSGYYSGIRELYNIVVKETPPSDWRG